VLVVTRMFFVPELMAFEQSAQSNLSPAEWRLRGIRWQRFSWIRGTVLFFAILPLLFSLTRTDEPSASNRISES
jgi:hypothetical protein